MSMHIQQLREWLKTRYDELQLSLEALGPGENAAEGTTVVWREVDEDGADLLDRQIGTWVRFSDISQQEDIPTRIATDVRWALNAVSRLEHRSGIVLTQADSLGAWQVHLVWIVDAGSKPDWDISIRNLRTNSAHAEEIGIDVLETTEAGLANALSRDGLPSLLFNTRKLLSKTADSIPEWLSPDKPFLALLSSLPKNVGDLEQRAFTQSFVDGLAFTDAADEGLQQSIAYGGQLSVDNFRNIVNADLRLDEIDGALVLHGPNGSGKSSIFEAICLALFGTSHRHVKYLADTDVSTALRKTYVSNVLSRFSVSNSEFAKISLGGHDVLTTLEPDLQAASDKMLLAHGTVLPQESSAEFVSMESARLATRVLGDYSPRSREVQAAVARGVQSAKEEWQNWLRSIGLSASITKPETILRKVISGGLTKFVPLTTSNTLDWLSDVSNQFNSLSELVTSVRSSWLDMDSLEAREALSNRIAKKVEASGSGSESILAWLRERANVSRTIESTVKSANALLAPLSDDWISIKEELTSWSQWIHKQSATDDSVSAENDNDANLIELLTQRLAELQPSGSLLRDRRDHVQNSISGVLRTWQLQFPHTCPTCDQLHERPIADVLTSVLERVEDEYAQVRGQYADLQEQIRALRKAQVVKVDSPVSTQRGAMLSEMFGYPQEGPDALENRVRSDAQYVVGLISRIERMLVSTSWQVESDPKSMDELAQRIASHVDELRREGFVKQESPAKWEALAAAINDISFKVVSNHLPNTIESVWREISLALAPARWNQVKVPDMAMNQQGKQEQLQVVIRRSDSSPAVPARHILNQAEQNLLGLSWFFTRHLTHGRFVAPLLVMDDPAQDMDQVTFRRFVRFLQAFLRLHKATGTETRVFLTLHQEDRALDVARAISPNAEVTVLDWAQQVVFRGSAATVKKVNLRNPQQRPPMPEPLLMNVDQLSSPVN